MDRVLRNHLCFFECYYFCCGSCYYHGQRMNCSSWPRDCCFTCLKWRDGTFSLFSAIFYYRLSICASTCSVRSLPPLGKVFKHRKVRAEEEQAALLMLRLVLLFHLIQGYLTFSTVVTALPFGKKSSQVSPSDVSMPLSWFLLTVELSIIIS